MEIEIGSIVKSLAGRDKERLFYVLEIDSGFAYLADGRLRKTETAKKKNLKHLQVVSNLESQVSRKIQNRDKVLNSEIRRALSDFAQVANREDTVSSTGR